MRRAPPTVPGTPMSPSIPPRSFLAQKVIMRPRSAAASTWAKLPSRTTSGSGRTSCRTTHGNSPSPTSRFEPPPRNLCGTWFASSRFRRSGRFSCFLMRSKSVVPPMPSEVRSAREVPCRSSTWISASLATILGSRMRMRRRMLRSQQNHKFIARPADIARADGKDSVSGTRLFQQVLDAFLHRVKIVDIPVTGLANGARQRFTGHARDGRFAGRIDIDQHENIDLIDLIDHALNVKAAAHAGKFDEAFADQVSRNVQVQRDCGCRRRVPYIVHARWMRQPEQTEIFAPVGQPEFAAQTFELHIADYQIGLARRSIGDDGTLHAGDNCLHVGLIDAEDRRAVKWHAIHKLDEGALNIFERAVLVEVFAVNGGHYGDHRRKHEEAAVALVRFHDKIFAFAEPRGSAGLVDFPADHKRGIEMGGCKNGSHD